MSEGGQRPWAEVTRKTPGGGRDASRQAFSPSALQARLQQPAAHIAQALGQQGCGFGKADIAA